MCSKSPSLIGYYLNCPPILLTVVSVYAKRRRKSLNVGTKCLDNVNKRKKCIIPINNDDDLCCARAIVTMRSHCHKHDGPDGVNSWNNLRHGLPLQKTQAEALHREAMVPLGACGIPELKQFQALLAPSYQLVVMCRSKPFMILYKGPDAPHQILLLKSNSHYDGCTSFPAFVNRSYFCLDCEKGFNTNDVVHHPCQGRICQCCQCNDCPDYNRKNRPTLLCTTCHCRFHGPSCKQHHLDTKQCERIRTCPSCQSKYAVNNTVTIAAKPDVHAAKRLSRLQTIAVTFNPPPKMKMSATHYQNGASQNKKQKKTMGSYLHLHPSWFMLI